jgi:ElaA protein
MEFIEKTFDKLTTNELYEILKARAEIFIMEQRILYQDMDDIDYRSLHCFFKENDKVTAYLRAFYTDASQKKVKIGRVLTLKHGSGIGKELLEQSLKAIKENMPCDSICMDAQKHAVGFYEKFGFQVTSDEFLEEGIVHVAMELKHKL